MEAFYSLRYKNYENQAVLLGFVTGVLQNYEENGVALMILRIIILLESKTGNQ